MKEVKVFLKCRMCSQRFTEIVKIDREISIEEVLRIVTKKEFFHWACGNPASIENPSVAFADVLGVML